MFVVLTPDDLSTCFSIAFKADCPCGEWGRLMTGAPYGEYGHWDTRTNRRIKAAAR